MVPSWLSADLLIVVSDGIARAFNRSGTVRGITLHICKASRWCGMLVFSQT